MKIRTITLSSISGILLKVLYINGQSVVYALFYKNIFLLEHVAEKCPRFNPRSLEGGGGGVKLTPPRFFWL